MKALMRRNSVTSLAFYKSLLENAGIETFVRNEAVSVTDNLGTVFMPELCVVNDADEERGRELIREAMRQAEDAPETEVSCPECGEKSPSNFDTCWKCGAALGEPA